jgi:hypothetical protein
MELAGIYLEEAIVKIEQEILNRRKQQLGKVLGAKTELLN